jgi:hypothetical protein
MPSNISPLFPPRTAPTSALVQVAEAAQGEARMLQSAEGRRCRVAGHLSHVPALAEGDWVLVSYVGDEAVVCGRLRGVGEALPGVLTQHDGVVELEAGTSLRLAAGKSIIELRADGRISIDGREVYTFGEQRVAVQGSTIELN